MYSRIPRKYRKKVASGRWEWVSEVLPDDILRITGIKRISTGEIWYFGKSYVVRKVDQLPHG